MNNDKSYALNKGMALSFLDNKGHVFQVYSRL
jgi:lipoprotein signal peptidase